MECKEENLGLDEKRSFEENFVIILLLESDGKKEEVVSSNIEDIELELHPYGYDIVVEFSAFDGEELHELFISEKPIEAHLTLQTQLATKEGEPPLEFKGMIHNRSYKEIGRGEYKKDLYLFVIQFSDFAKTTWSSHFPKSIYLEKTMKDVFDAEKNPLISLNYDWDILNEEHPILAFSLPEHKKVNFYSFLIWYLYQEGGVLEYDYKKHSYSILREKKSDGEVLDVMEWWTSSPFCIHPTPSHSSKRSIKHSADEIENDDDENEDAFQKVRNDIFDSSAYTYYPEQNIQNIKSQLIPEKPEIIFYINGFFKSISIEQLVP